MNAPLQRYWIHTEWRSRTGHVDLHNTGMVVEGTSEDAAIAAAVRAGVAIGLSSNPAYYGLVAQVAP